jgi:phosphatidylglycerol lysyltransferase
MAHVAWTSTGDSRFRGGVAAARRVPARSPLTLGLLVLLWVVGAASGALLSGPSTGLRDLVGAGLGPVSAGRWWVPLTAPLWASGLPGYLWSSVVVALGVGLAERVLGTRRVAALALLVQVLGTALGLGFVALVAMTGGQWGAQLRDGVAVGPTPLAIGCALAVSAGLTALWRRRLRVLLLVGLAMLVLYSGLLVDVLRLACGLVGLLVGAVWLGRARRRGGRTELSAPSRRETRVLVALVVAASALGPLIAVLAETRVGPLSVLRFVFASPPPDAATVDQLCADPSVAVGECRELRARLRLSGVGPGVMSVMPVLLLLVAAEGLRRGRRAAWLAAFVLNLGLAVLGGVLAAVTAATPAEQRIVLGPGVHLHSWLALGLPALQPLLVALLLVAVRDRFPARARPGTYRRWGRVVGLTAVAVSVGYVLGSTLVADQYVPPPGLRDLVADLPTRFLPPGYLGEFEPAFLPQGFLATLLFEWTGVLFWSVVLVAGLTTFGRTPPPAAGSDPARIRALLAGTSGSSLAHMATWPGQSYLFVTGPAGDDVAAVAYRVINAVAVTTGDPVGDPKHHERAVADFTELCAQQGWTPCLYSVDARIAELARELGWHTVQVAEETVVPLGGLTFTGRRWQDVRTALNKAGRAGITAEWLTWRAAPLALTDQIRAISEEWVADKGLPEMAFTLGGLDELADDEVRLLLAVDADRTVHGVTSWLPVRRDGAVVGWTLDFMRRRGDGFRGVMEFLIASAALHAQDDGAEFLSLSGAPLARLDRGEPGDALQRLLDLAGRSLEPVYGFRSLLAFKAKFQPEYRPLFLAYPDPAALPRIGTAIGRAYLPHVGPRQFGRLVRRVMR